MKLPLPFATYALESTQASPKRLVNCFIESLQDKNGKGPILLRRNHGIKAWSSAGDRGRGLHVFNNTLYAAATSSLYSVNSSGVATSLGLIGGSGLTSMSHNTDTIVVVTNPSAYYYNGTFGQITDVDFITRGASQVSFLGNWLIFLEPNSGRNFAADITTATSFAALNFATAEGDPDNTIAILTDQQQLAQFGDLSLELSYDTGGSGYPFDRLPSGGFMELGCAAARSPAKADNSFFWLANDLTVRRLNGTTPVRVSTHAIEEQIASFAIKSDAIALTYTFTGHIYYVLTFPSARRTFVFDITTTQWNERMSWQGVEWLPISYAYCYGRHLVQDLSGRIGELDANTYDDLGDAQVMQWTYQTVYSENSTAFHDRLEIIAEKGVGQSAGQGFDPQIMLEVSDDGGKNFRHISTKSLGKQGEYKARAVWNRLGSAKQRTYRCSVSDPVNVTVTDTQLNVRGGRL